jgi:hypothetical protein
MYMVLLQTERDLLGKLCVPLKTGLPTFAVQMAVLILQVRPLNCLLPQGGSQSTSLQSSCSPTETPPPTHTHTRGAWPAH